MQDDRHPGGRPSKYDPAFCEKVVEWGKLGKSRSWMASRLDVSHQTVINWEHAHPEFLEAMTRAEAHAQAHWEDLGHDNIMMHGFNSSVWSRSMAARFPKHWREKTAVVGGDEGDSPVKQEVTHTGVEQVLGRISGLAARIGAQGSASGTD
mgnify:FL=1